jgi:hypothetical protein
MKPEHIYERRQSAGRMEAVMVLTSVIGIATAILALFTYGWVSGLAVFLLSLIAYGLSRVFDFLSDVLLVIGRDEQRRSVRVLEEGK